ncbi:DUF1850 domain-containing protein [Yoonia sp.]|uniref:DUF1850 domain-containing protein n=1 Tax=Yoonia sp. TaxID=2212373 RepID=UPI003A4D40FB
MTAMIAGRRLGAALFLGVMSGVTPLVAQTFLVVETSGSPLGALPFEEGQEICLTWNHSVTGGAVADCFENQDGSLTLMRSYLHDFAAGLGEMEGRGQIILAENGGYWINAINEPIAGNALALRIGPDAVNHVLAGPDQSLLLSQMAPDTRVRLSLERR